MLSDKMKQEFQEWEEEQLTILSRKYLEQYKLCDLDFGENFAKFVYILKAYNIPFEYAKSSDTSADVLSITLTPEITLDYFSETNMHKSFLRLVHTGRKNIDE